MSRAGTPGGLGDTVVGKCDGLWVSARLAWVWCSGQCAEEGKVIEKSKKTSVSRGSLLMLSSWTDVSSFNSGPWSYSCCQLCHWYSAHAIGTQYWSVYGHRSWPLPTFLKAIYGDTISCCCLDYCGLVVTWKQTKHPTVFFHLGFFIFLIFIISCPRQSSDFPHEFHLELHLSCTRLGLTMGFPTSLHNSEI